nr:hypothetical protein [Bacteroidota bacterium]
MLAIPGNCRIEYSLTGININSIYIPSGDTIYQIDTVYHYEIIYDTLFYFDTIPKADTLMVYDTIVEDTDSTVIVKQLLTINVKKNKTIFTSGDYKVPENQKREFDDIEKNTGSENTTRFDLEQDVENAYKGTYKINDNTAENSKRGNPFTYQVRDTIYRFDTVINTETVFDTVFFAASSHSNDTSVTNHVEYQKYGSSVLAKEIVNVKVSKKESIFFEKSTKHSGSGDRKTNSGKNKNLATTTPVRSRKWKRDLKRASHTNRNNIDTDYSNWLKAGVSLFYPDITFNAENPEVAANVQLLNEHTNARLSYGAFLKYNYFQKNWGFETGLGFTRQNFDFDHQFQVPKVDTSWYWDYFNKESFLYDTTWYINLDTLLQTGDTLLIPNIDSTMIWLTDSTHKTKFDTSYMAQSKR